MRALLILIMAVMASGGALWGDNTLRGKKLKVSRDARTAMHPTPLPQPTDTLRNPSPIVFTVSGYDKPLRTSRETFLVTNDSPRDMKRLALSIVYTDMKGRQLHQRTDTIDADVPAGETRMLKISTWDTQHSFYYHRGQRPRTANVTPYDVKFNIDFIIQNKETNTDD